MSLWGLYRFVFPEAGELGVLGGCSLFGEVRGVFLQVPALPGVPGCSPPSFPKFTHKREAVACGGSCQKCGGHEGVVGAQTQILGCVGAMCTLHPTPASPGPRHWDGMAQLRYIHGTSCPAREEPRDSMVLP